MTRLDELYVEMDSHPAGRIVWRSQNPDLSRELDDLESEADEAEADELERREWEEVK